MATKLVKPLKKTNAPLLEIRQKKGATGYMVGANTELLLDGKPVKGAQAVTFEVDAKGLAKATITIVGRFKISGYVKPKKVKLYR